MKIAFRIIAVIGALSILGALKHRDIFVFGIILTMVFAYLGWFHIFSEPAPKKKELPPSSTYTNHDDSFTEQHKSAFILTLAIFYQRWNENRMDIVRENKIEHLYNKLDINEIYHANFMAQFESNPEFLTNVLVTFTPNQTLSLLQSALELLVCSDVEEEEILDLRNLFLNVTTFTLLTFNRSVVRILKDAENVGGKILSESKLGYVLDVLGLVTPEKNHKWIIPEQKFGNAFKAS